MAWDRSDYEAYKAYVASLNSDQKAVHDELCNVTSRQPVRIVAAAGSGKTRTVLAAAATILNERILSPKDLVVTTFTRKAAEDMKRRFRGLVDPSHMQGLRMGTFHSLAGTSLWRQDVRGGRAASSEAPKHLWSRTANIDTRDYRGPKRKDYIFEAITGGKYDRGRLVRMEDFGLPGEQPLDLIQPGDDISQRDYQLAIGVLRGYGFTPGDVLTIEAGKEMLETLEQGLPQLHKVWELYERAKKYFNAYDFEDILYHYWRRTQDKARLVIVDEAQDNTAVQIGIAQRLAAQGKGRFAFVGDVRQAIYSWRGAVPELMATADVKLRAMTKEIPTNYRSGRLIVALGNRVAINPETLQPEAWSVGAPAQCQRLDVPELTRRVGLRVGNVMATYTYGQEPHPWRPGTQTPDGTVRVLAGGRTPLDEAEKVADEIAALHAQGVSRADMAILCRTNAPMVFYEYALIRRQQPVIRLGGGPGFFDRVAVKRALSYVALAYEDRAGDMLRIYRYPSRDVHYKNTEDLLKGPGGTMPVQAAINELIAQSPRHREGYTDLARTIQDLRDRAQRSGMKNVLEQVQKLLEPPVRDGEPDDTPAHSEDDADSALVAAFVEFASGLQGGWPELVQWVAQMTDPKNVVGYSASEMDNWSEEQLAGFESLRKERVILSSIHRSKGLEWKFVWMSCTQNVFPHARTEYNAGRREEEKRLFYVGTTRAADVLTLTYSTVTVNEKPGGRSSYISTYVLPMLEEEGLTEHGTPAKRGETAVDASAVDEAAADPVTPETAVRSLLDEIDWRLIWTDERNFIVEGLRKANRQYKLWVIDGQVKVAPEEGWQKDDFVSAGTFDDLLDVVQLFLLQVEARINTVLVPGTNDGKPYHPPATEAPSGSFPQAPTVSNTSARWTSFLDWVAQQDGEARPGLSWREAADILAKHRPDLLETFKTLR